MNIEKKHHQGNGRHMKGAPKKGLNFQGDVKHHMTIKKEERLKEREEISNTIYGDGKTLLEIGNNECRWPVGDVYCSAKTDGASYCEHHHSIAFIPKPKKEGEQ